jgi:hypothetical protein
MFGNDIKPPPGGGEKEITAAFKVLSDVLLKHGHGSQHAILTEVGKLLGREFSGGFSDHRHAHSPSFHASGNGILEAAIDQLVADALLRGRRTTGILNGIFNLLPGLSGR